MNKSYSVDTSEIRYEETDMSVLVRYPCRFECDVQIVCVEGHAKVCVGTQVFILREKTELLLVGGCSISVSDRSPDFSVRMLMFPKEVVLKAILPLDTEFINYMRKYPFIDHSAKEMLPEGWSCVLQWMDMAKMIFTHPIPAFRKHIEHNFLQTMLMCIFNHVPRKEAFDAREYSRRQILFHQFVRLVRENARTEHQVSFYAGKLSVSARYLGGIVAEYFNGKTPKQMIDEQLTAEIKAQLDNLQMSVCEISEYFRFPECASLNRFFKRNTGMSPSKYRLTGKFQTDYDRIFIEETPADNENK